MLANLLNLRNVAILAGLCLTAFAVQSLRIKVKNHKIDNLKAEIVRLDSAIEMAIDTNVTNQNTIHLLKQANQQCALTRQMNEQHARNELNRHKGAIADISKRYENLRKAKISSKCANVLVDDSVIRMLKQSESNHAD